MPENNTSIASTFLILFLSTMLISANLYSQKSDGSQSQKITAARIGEGVLRSNARVSPVPSFPKESVKETMDKVGVAGIQVSAAGKVVSIVIEEAPDHYISNTLSQTLKAWTFDPFLIGGQPTPVSSTITYYFRCKKYDCTVELPRSLSRTVNINPRSRKAD